MVAQLVRLSKLKKNLTKLRNKKKKIKLKRNLTKKFN
jgi:hypothetical protein